MRVFDFGAFAEEGVGLVEKEDCVRGLGFFKDAAQILFRLADVCADDGREINLESFQP